MPVAPLDTANKRNLLQIIQDASAELGLAVPTSVVGNTDDQTVQMLSIAQREGNEFSISADGKGGWQELINQYSFLTATVTGVTGNTTLGSRIITNIPSTASLVANRYSLSGAGLPNQAIITSVDSATQVTIDRPCTATGTAVALTAGQKAYTFPSGIARFIDQSWWDGSYRWQLLGPLSSQEKQVLKYGISPTGPRRRFWIEDNLVWIDPTPTTANDVIAFDYYSEYWARASDGLTEKARFTADTDYYVLDDDCMVMGIKWRFLRAKGLDYGEEFNSYMERKNMMIARNGGRRSLPINARNQGQRLLNQDNIPDTGFGS